MHVRSLLSTAFLCFAIAVLLPVRARAARIAFEDLDAIAEICQLSASGQCTEPVLAIVRAEFNEERGFRAEWRPAPTVDRSATFRARLSAFRAPLAETDFALPGGRDRDEVHVGFVLDIGEFFVVPATGGSAHVGRIGAAVATRDSAASVVVPAGALFFPPPFFLPPPRARSTPPSPLRPPKPVAPEKTTLPPPARGAPVPPPHPSSAPNPRPPGNRPRSPPRRG